MLEQYLLLHADCKCCLMRPPFISRRCLYELSHHIRPGGRPFLCLPAGHGLTGGRKRDQLFPAGVQKMPPGDTSDCCWPAASGQRREMENKPQIQTKRCISSCTDQVHRLMCSQQTTVSIIPCMNTYVVMYLFVMTVALDSVWSLLSQSLTSVHFDLFKHLTCDFCWKTLSYIFLLTFSFLVLKSKMIFQLMFLTYGWSLANLSYSLACFHLQLTFGYSSTRINDIHSLTL